MQLSLIVLRCPDAVVPEQRDIEGGEFSLGRGPGVDWVLPDPDRVLSKRHCVLGFRAGIWHLADTSTNGTFLNRDADPVGAGAPRPLCDGDRVRLGAYEIELRIAEAPSVPQRGGGRSELMDDPFASVSPKMSGSLAKPSPASFANPFAEPSDAQPFDASSFGGAESSWDAPAPPAGSYGSASIGFDPFAPEPSEFGGNLARAPTQSDHSPDFENAVQLQRPAPSLLPDDWDIEQSARPPAAPRPIQPPQELPPVPVRTVPPPAVAELPVVQPPPAAAPAPSVAGPDLLAAFLRGAGLADAKVKEPEAMMEALGAAFRAVIAGTRDVLMARADIKGEFRIEQTMVRARGNNPLKFSTSDDDALTALLGTGRPVDMTPAAAITDALRDIKLHELASLAAMQSAVRALLASFDPVKLRTGADQASGLSLLPAQKKARAFDAFEALHNRTQLALSDDFDSVFGRAFARAYEQALAEFKQKAPP